MSPSSDQPTNKRVPLTRERILAASIELADETGVAGLTIRKLAIALKVKPMAIYHHVLNKEAILDGMVDLVFDEIERPPSDLEWKEAIWARCWSARTVLAAHPWAAALMDSRSNPGPATLGHHDSVLGCFRRAGFSIEMTAHAYALIDSYIYGFALQEASLPPSGGDEMADLAGEITAEVEPQELPYLSEMAEHLVMKPGYHFGDEFEFGLALLLDALADRV